MKVIQEGADEPFCASHAAGIARRLQRALEEPGELGDENVTINADEGGNIAFNLPFVKGQVKVPSGFMHNGNFDMDGVKLMPGSQVTGVSVDAHDDGSTVNMAFTAPAPPDQVRSYFVDQFKKQGVEAALAGDIG